MSNHTCQSILGGKEHEGLSVHASELIQLYLQDQTGVSPALKGQNVSASWISEKNAEDCDCRQTIKPPQPSFSKLFFLSVREEIDVLQRSRRALQAPDQNDVQRQAPWPGSVFSNFPSS